MTAVEVRCPKCAAIRTVEAPKEFVRIAAVPKPCPECVEAEYQAMKAEADRDRAVGAAERREKRAAEILPVLRQTGVNVRDHRNATFATFDASEAGDNPVKAAREFLAEVRAAGDFDQVRGLYLCGETGSGKSHLAVAVARELLLDPDIHPNGVVFDHALRLIGEIQRTYGTDKRAEEVLQRRIDARLWILDDLGTEAPSADVVRRLTEIFTERAMAPTVVTSNLRPDELEARNPEFFRVVSRLGGRYFRTVRVKGRDRRFEAAA